MFGKRKESDTPKELNMKSCALSDDELEHVSGGSVGTELESFCAMARTCGGRYRPDICGGSFCPYRDFK